MNHRRSHTVKKIGKDYKHKKAILKSLSSDVIRHEKILTTKPKARLLRSFLEKIIHRAKVDTLHNRREVYKKIRDTKLLKKLFENIAKRYGNRNGGYLRIIKAGQRKGDAADVCYVMLTEEILSSKDEKKPSDEKIVDKSSSSKEKNKKETKGEKNIEPTASDKTVSSKEEKQVDEIKDSKESDSKEANREEEKKVSETKEVPKEEEKATEKEVSKEDKS